MTTLREAAQQALEALKMIDNAMPFPVAKHAIKQLSDALAEPVQRPSADLIEAVDTLLNEALCDCPDRMKHERGEHLSGCHLFDVNEARLRMTQSTEPEQEPVLDREATWWSLVMGAAAAIENAEHCLRDEDAIRAAKGAAKHYREKAEALYTHPAPQPVELTDEEIKYATLEQQNHLLDHIYEYGVSAEGVTQRIYKLARAVIEAYQRKQEGKHDV